MKPSIGDIWKWKGWLEPQYLLVLNEDYDHYDCLNLNTNEIGSWLMATEDEDEGLDWEWIA